MRWLLGFVVVAMSLYGAYAAALVLLQGHFLYPFSDRSFSSPHYTRAEIAVAEAADLPVRVADAGPGAPVVVYFMGNVGALDIFLPMLDHHRTAGRTVVAMTYRGGGGTPGKPSEARLKADALALMDALPTLVPEAGPVILHGYSLGTGLAIHVAAQRPVDGILLSAPYARICELMAKTARLPACQIPGVQGWTSADNVTGITAPVAILHGSDDTLIPPDHSARLAQAMQTAGITVDRQVIPKGGHSNLMGTPGYLSTLDRMIQTMAAQAD